MTKLFPLLALILVSCGGGEPPEITYFTDGSAGIFEFDKGEFEVVNFPNSDVNVRITYTFDDYILLELVDSTGKLIDWQNPLQSSAQQVDPFNGYVDMSKMKEPVETVYVHDTVTIFATPIPIDSTSRCLYASEYAVCKVRGHDLTHRVGWSDFPNPYYDETYFECKWCGATIQRIINSPAPDTTHKEKRPGTR